MNFLTWPISVEMNFSPREFNDWVDYVLPYALQLAAANMVCLAIATFIRASFSPKPIFSILFVALAIAFTMFVTKLQVTLSAITVRSHIFHEMESVKQFQRRKSIFFVPIWINAPLISIFSPNIFLATAPAATLHAVSLALALPLPR